MSNLSRGNQRNIHKHLLVFDTPALLSANAQNPEQDWRNNQQLGDCYLPGGTFAELYELEKKGDVKAKKFIAFQQKWQNYTILDMEDNRKIPIPDSVNQRDRQILACAFNLARQHSNCVVVLVTYERIMQVLVNQRQVEELVPNFCTIPASALAWWYHTGLAQRPERFPDPVWNAQRRMRESRRTPPEPLPPSRFQGNQPRPISGGNNQQPLPPSPPTPSPIRKPTSPLPPVNQPQPQPQPPQRSPQNRSPNYLIMGLVALAILLPAVLFGIGNFTRRDSTTVVPQVPVANPKPLQPTSQNLIGEAQAGIIQFQRTNNPSDLTKPLNVLQELKNQQGGQLDDQGEQSLSRLKHKYAVEVLASSGQLAEAAKILREIPQSYSDIQAVRDWLTKQNR